MMILDDYKDKLQNLPAVKLQALIERYRKTIIALETQQKESRMMALMPVVHYTEQELVKKHQELAAIEQILSERKS